MDEGAGTGGEYGPYRQSERKDLYKQYALQLVASGHAYYSFDTAEELDNYRKSCEAQKETFIYNATTRIKLRNSLTMDADQVRQLLEAGEPYVIRFKMPENEELHLKDIIRGEVRFHTSLLDDKVLFKSDGMPTYHLANVVDDYLMKITHVIRGEEWLPSLPLHVLLYRSFGWTEVMPEFAHLPLILKPVGNGKLSKRDGNKMGFPVFPMQWTDPETKEIWHGYKEDGYFPEAFINMLALLGWNDGTDKEIFSLEELCQAFSLERVHKERANFVKDIYNDSLFFFVTPEEYNEKDVKKYWKEESIPLMQELYNLLSKIEDYSFANTEKIISAWINTKEIGFGKVMNPFRVAIVGAAKGPHMFNIIEIIGKTETLKRLEKALNTLK